MTKAKYMGWLDLETTGLEEQEGIILEVGIAVTHMAYPFEVIGTISEVVKPTSEWKSLMIPKVVEMHTKTQLINAVESAVAMRATVERIILDWLDLICGKKSTLMLCGSGVSHFDRRWLKFHMPQLEERFSYETLDVGVIRRAFAVAGGPNPRFWGMTNGTPHRALDDAMDHLEEWRQYATLMNPQQKEK